MLQVKILCAVIKTCAVCVSCSVLCDSLQPHGLQPTRLLCPWDSPGKNTGVDSHALLQGIFPNQRSNPGLLHCKRILYQLSYHRSPGDMAHQINKYLKKKERRAKQSIDIRVHFLKRYHYTYIYDICIHIFLG